MSECVREWQEKYKLDTSTQEKEERNDTKIK